MSDMWGWFGGQSAQSRKDTPKNAILVLRSQLEMLQRGKGIYRRRWMSRTGLRGRVLRVIRLVRQPAYPLAVGDILVVTADANESCVQRREQR